MSLNGPRADLVRLGSLMRVIRTPGCLLGAFKYRIGFEMQVEMFRFAIDGGIYLVY